MVSNASEDLPDPLKPVTTTNLSRGIFSVRFLRLCSRAPPILIKSLLTMPNFAAQTIGNLTQAAARSKDRKSRKETQRTSRERTQRPQKQQRDSSLTAKSSSFVSIFEFYT